MHGGYAAPAGSDRFVAGRLGDGRREQRGMGDGRRRVAELVQSDFVLAAVALVGSADSRADLALATRTGAAPSNLAARSNRRGRDSCNRLIALAHVAKRPAHDTVQLGCAFVSLAAPGLLDATAARRLLLHQRHAHAHHAAAGGIPRVAPDDYVGRRLLG